MSIPKILTDQVVNQCVNYLSAEPTQNQIQSRVLDPLINYFKERFKYLYLFVIIVMMIILIISSIIMIQIYQIAKSMTIPNLTI